MFGLSTCSCSVSVPAMTAYFLYHHDLSVSRQSLQSSLLLTEMTREVFQKTHFVSLDWVISYPLTLSKAQRDLILTHDFYTRYVFDLKATLH